ncbi:MAG: type II toxin-antitoxin system VapB family antitoxin [Xanthomonadaceae bacterium]|nr:type II toxin-antitoxin system VapB family antitoxin [Xanthomonadaceae bacterium]HJR10570.1 type II toxin-antitoxin system VapB family antitoxin [Rhodanobacteraceae bacterium]
MRTTITLDDKLLKQAGQAIGTDERSVVIHEGLKALVQREAARRLIQLGGSVPDAQLPPRRRPEPAATAHRKRA